MLWEITNTLLFVNIFSDWTKCFILFTQLILVCLHCSIALSKKMFFFRLTTSSICFNKPFFSLCFLHFLSPKYNEYVTRQFEHCKLLSEELSWHLFFCQHQNGKKLLREFYQWFKHLVSHQCNINFALFTPKEE